ncbi:MAG TPA: hypothetical protein VEH27_08335 [Methylomirabilota bacterium]|nr:hypothetical protein [Methylomirabilota bacterium]
MGDAFPFPDSATAMNFYMRHYLPDVEVIALVDNAGKGVHLHLNDDQAPRTSSVPDSKAESAD